MWDDEVDVLCVGAGVGGLAAAIIGVDSGLEVFVARTVADRAQAETLRDRAQSWFGTNIADDETREYLSALSVGIDLQSADRWDAGVPVRVVDTMKPVEPGRTVPTFRGSRLRDWTQRCVMSPYGVLYSQVSRCLPELRARNGDHFNVAVIGSVDAAALDGSGLSGWFAGQARDRDIPMSDGFSLNRIVFEEGSVVGAVFDTPDGHHAVRARHGVAIASDGSYSDDRHMTADLADCGELAVGMVGQIANRFNRVELLATAIPTRAGYCKANRSLPSHSRAHGRMPARRTCELHR
jgi:hypothetical protein